jgi:hypothetical protein
LTIGRTRIRAVRSLEDAVALFGELGYTAKVLPVQRGHLALPGLERVLTARNTGRRRTGYGLVFGEAKELPRSFRPLAKAMRLQVHDRPLGVIGLLGDGGRWERMIIIRPRTGSAPGSVALAKLDVDLTSPTQHDCVVLEGLAWRNGDDEAAHRRIDQALDVEAVTNRFYRGLREHFDTLKGAVQAAADGDPAITEAIKSLGADPAERAALRILTQILFVEFLQRKGLVDGRADWLSFAYKTKSGPYYESVLEPLFYDALGTPQADRRSGLPDAPYLDGGLFTRFYRGVSLPLPDEVFDLDSGLLGYLDQWTFTVAEEMPDEAEVAVDPEMLGKVFEHLAGEDAVQKHGTVYTPRPVVHYMCREALVPWLESQASLTEAEARSLLTEPAPFDEGPISAKSAGEKAALATRVSEALGALRVLDPAVGSGAFLLGMLSEVVRLRTLCHKVLNQGAEPGAEQVYAWKEAAIRQSLYGVDIEPRAVELCRLRLWLSLIVDLPAGAVAQPLPNLEYRTVVANSLVDFVNGVEIQNTRGGLSYFAEEKVTEMATLHDRWFHAAGEEREQLRQEIIAVENEAVQHQLQDAIRHASSEEERLFIEGIARRFASPDREFPCFVPALHAPEIALSGGWDIVIMNPPYVGKKEVSRRLAEHEVSDLKTHYGEVNDLMILFALRALEYVKRGGVVSMIFNDSVTTSADGNEIRRYWTEKATLRALARTKCFEGKAVNGLVVVLEDVEPSGDESVIWVEGYRKDVGDFAAASGSKVLEIERGATIGAGSLELWRAPLSDYRVLPHRPLFRPSPEALKMLERFKTVRDWDVTDGWATWGRQASAGWRMLSNTRALNRWIAAAKQFGFYERLKAGEWVLLGTVIEGGQGLATADDKTFIAAIDGTEEAKKHLANQERIEQLTLKHPEAAEQYRAELASGREAALLAVWERYYSDLSRSGKPYSWPRGATFRIADPGDVRTAPLSDEERRNGIASGPHFVPFEKGDDSDEADGHAIGARWVRENPLVIDWSTDAVALLRKRKAAGGARAPYWRNEHLWFSEGVTWNRTASYLRVRQVARGAIFGADTAVVRPIVEWLSAVGLLALLNSDTVDFIVRTFLGSRMHIEIGDIRRVPVPVLSPDQSNALDALGAEAIAAKKGEGKRELAEIEAEINAYVRDLYGIPQDADLWVVR